MSYVGYLLVGLGGGAVIASLALGVVLTYRASGVVNFAYAAMGMYIGFAYYELRQTGDLVLPVLGLPARLRVIASPTVFTALVVSLVLAAVLGLVVYWLVFRPLRSAPPLARVVASLGLFLYLVTMVDLRFGEQGATVFQITSVLPSGRVEVFGVVVPTDRFLLAGIAIIVTAALWAVFRYTRFGLATRAAAESEKGAVLLGHAPDRLAALNWMVASVLAGGAVILIAGTTKQLNATTTSLLIVPALAAALLGRLRSFPLTTAAGLAIGMVQSAVLQLVTSASWIPDWLPRGGVQQALPFVVILVAITASGASLPTRGALEERRFPTSPRPRRPVLAAALLGTATAVVIVAKDDWRAGLAVSMTAALIALSSVVLTGYVGQISLAQYAIAGVAGFATAQLATKQGVAFPFSPVVGIAAAVVVGLLAGIPAVRVRGMTLAIATIGAAVAVQELAFTSTAFTGGLGGLDVPSPELFGLDLDPGRGAYPRVAFAFFALVVLVLACLAVANLRRSVTGLRWLAVRANERAAAAAGVDVTRAKLSAFAVASLLAGLGGVMLGYQQASLSPDQFAVVGALALLALTYLGGIASISGALIAGALTTSGFVTAVTGGGGSEYQFAISGVALIVVAILYPDGISGAVRVAWHRVTGRVGA